MGIQEVSQLVFRQLTPADFFNINKQPNTEAGGGGQSYIDVPVNNVSLENWRDFFDGSVAEETLSGPLWNIEIRSLGRLGSQTVGIGQRRSASVNIRSQKLHSRQSNRIYAWHPDFSDFPRAPSNMTSAEDSRVIEMVAGVRVFIVKCSVGNYWAGWLRTESIESCVAHDKRFKKMLTEPAGYIQFSPFIKLNTENLENPFVLSQPSVAVFEDLSRKSTASNAPPRSNKFEQNDQKIEPYNSKGNRSIEEITINLFQEDYSSSVPEKTTRSVQIYERNKKVARDLKNLYDTCQITGNQFVFNRTNGKPYLELHHLIPLGDGGSDNPSNLVVISAHIHRMLHYGIVEGIDLANIKCNQLKFKINGDEYTITWHPSHANLIAKKGGNFNSL